MRHLWRGLLLKIPFVLFMAKGRNEIFTDLIRLQIKKITEKVREKSNKLK